MKLKHFFVSLLLITLSTNTFSVITQYPKDKTQLERDVKSILRQSNVDIRSEVEKVFVLGDIYNFEDNYKKAIYYYDQGLRADGWNLSYQFKLAKLLSRDDQKTVAIEKAKLVFDYAENQDLIKKSLLLLEELGEKHKKLDGKMSTKKTATIALVPLGEINPFLLQEVIAEAEKVLGVSYSFYDLSITDLGKFDRNHATRRISSIYKNILSHVEKTQMDDRKKELGVLHEDPFIYESKKKIVLSFIKEEASDEELDAFIADLSELEKIGQYNAKRLEKLLWREYQKNKLEGVRGCVGITKEGIYAKDYNFLFGWGGQSYAVMSYHRFTADFNDEKPNRPLLVKRTLKQCISSTFMTLGILERCTSPTCARAYPNDLAEHDRKAVKLCDWCKNKLKQELGVAKVKVEH